MRQRLDQGTESYNGAKECCRVGGKGETRKIDRNI